MLPAKKQENSILSEASSLVQTWISQINDQPRLSFGAESLHLSDASRYVHYGNPTSYQAYGPLKEQPIHNYLGNDDYQYLMGGDDKDDGGCGHRGPPDYVAGFDWSEGEVGENVRHVLNGLLETEVTVPKGGRDWIREDDPVVSIEMRHKCVKERRKQRDNAHQEALRDQQRKIEVRRRAREMIKREEEERRQREKREEEVIKGHMAAIKRQMKEQKERERAIREHLESIENVKKKQKEHIKVQQQQRPETDFKRGVVKDSETACQTDCIKIETEIEVLKIKRRAKVLRCCFLSWYSLVREHLGLVRKAEVVGEWRLLLRYWRVWRGVVKNRFSKKMALQAANELRQEKRKLKLADDHYCYKLLRKFFTSWHVLVISSRLHRKTEHDRLAGVRERVSLYLSERERRPENCHEPGEREAVKHPLKSPSTGERREMAVQTEAAERKEQQRVNKRGMWFKARCHVDTLLSEGARLMAEKHSKERENEANHNNTTESCDQSHDLNTLPLLSQANAIQMDHHKASTQTTKLTTNSKPSHTTKKTSTKPLELKGMKERSALISERRLAREERRRKREEEKVAELKAEEERKCLEEKRNREVELARRREEKRLAAEREANRQRKLKHFQELTNRANGYYLKHLLKKCLIPWTLFTRHMKESRVQATRCHDLSVMKSAWWVWFCVVRTRVGERNKMADSLYRRRLLLHSVKRWIKFIANECEILRYYEQKSKVLLVRKLFKGWERVTRTERIRMWEKERRARKHHERKLLQVLLHAWLKYIPIACEERKREVRRAELRRKVCLWLPDYKPQEQDELFQENPD